jgi:hypothetical protein
MSEEIESAIGDEIPQEGKLSCPPKEEKNSAIEFDIFSSGIKRAENLLCIDLNSDSESIEITEDKLKDSYRAVVVLSISALDAYIKMFLIIKIKNSLNEKKLPSDLKRYIKDELFSKDELHQVVLENSFYDKVIEKFDADFEKRSFQGQKSIDKFMKLAGYNQIFKQIADSADKSINNLLRSIEEYTTRRHLIVHCGDHDLNQTEITENSISKDYASNCLDLVKLIANEIHKISQS